MRHFLVTRKVDLGLARIEVFDSHQKAKRAFDSGWRREEKRPSHKRASLHLFADIPHLGALLDRDPALFDVPASSTHGAADKGEDE